MAVLVSLLMAGALAPAAGIAAQDGPGANDVVVTGKAKPTAERLRTAGEYIRRVGALRDERQLARWIDPVCVRVLGIAGEPAAFVTDSIGRIAAQAGVRVAGPACRPNIVISFTGDGAALARAIHTRAIAQMAEAPPDIRRTILTGDAGIRWWYSTQQKGSDGRELVTGPPMAAPRGGEGGTSLLPDKPTLAAYTSSAVATYTIRTLTSATAIVDVRQASGFSLRTVAQYLAMVTLAEVYARQPPPQDSILEAFSGPASPKALTPQDRAFLAALYHVPLDRPSRYQKGAMAVAFAQRSP